MKSNNIVFVEKNVAKLVQEDIKSPQSNEILVKLCVSTLSSGTERAQITGNRSLSVNSAEKEANSPAALDTAHQESLNK